MMVPNRAFHLAKEMVTSLRAKHYQAFFVGGCVRDHVLGRPMTDIDLVTDATIEQCLALFPQAKKVGRQFSVLLVRRENYQFELARFRQEAARPDDLFKQDASQRDFTINSLYYDPMTDTILDPIGGQRDMALKVVRFNSQAQARIQEDPQRMLRAVRLAVTYRFELEPASLRAIQQSAGLINQVAKERVLPELEKIWMAEDATCGCRILATSHLLSELLPEVQQTMGVRQPPASHPEGDCFEHTCLTLHYLPKPASRYLAWAAVLHDIGKPVTQTGRDDLAFPHHAKIGAAMVRQVLQRLKADHKFIQQVETMVRYHGQLGKIRSMKKSTLKRMQARQSFADELKLYYADKMAGDQKLANYEHACSMIQKLAQDQHTLERARQLITGHDLTALGLQPGPNYRSILVAIQDDYLDHKISTREQALIKVKALVKQHLRSRSR